MRAIARSFFILVTLSIMPGCADRHIYEGETFKSKDHYTRAFRAPPKAVMRACRNAALQAQYVVQEENEHTRFLRVFKSNHVANQDDRYAGLTIEVNVSPASPETSLVRSVAVERQYEVTKNREFAQAGIGPLLNIPLPTGETQTVTEVRRDTVDDQGFYENLYEAIETQLPQAITELSLENTQWQSPVPVAAARPPVPEPEPPVVTTQALAPQPDRTWVAETVRVDERAREPELEPEPEPLEVAEDRPLRRGEIRRTYFIPER